MDEHLSRRRFLEAAAGVAVGLTAGGDQLSAGTRGVAIVVDPGDPIASSAPARWAATELQRSLAARGIAAEIAAPGSPTAAARPRITSAGCAAPGAAATLRAAGVRVDDVPEALALCPERGGILACGRDPRGLTYALLELVDRVRHAADPLAAIALSAPVVERPANTVRSLTRLFTSDVEDMAWFNDRAMWPEYFSHLATQRFNRFSLAFGIGYDFLTNVTDAYFLFAYPFLLQVPGHRVRVPQLADAERDRNLEMLQFIARQAVTCGLDFHLGLWMHGYRWNDSPRANYTIEGLTPETHGAYCRDAVRALLQAVPEIAGVTFRVHGESGVEEGSYQFWRMVFDGVATCGRRVEIDMHAKGMDQGLIDAALGSGQPVTISPKYWAEHLGLPYHQADIRAQEWPRTDAAGLMKFSAGSRNFLRYGYGDLLREDRAYRVLHRVWPGTQRLLIWGDPLTAGAYSRAFSFCGSSGAEIMEPLSFKGRRGSGLAGGRCAYDDRSLEPRWDWQKYAYSLRVWGRMLYNPEAEPDVWQRAMRRDFGPAGQGLEEALARASRILPTLTTAHLPSAANNAFWPEIYLNQSLIDGEHGPYTDTPSPRVFGTVSPLDPQLFYRIDDFADALLDGARSGKYTPIEVATWLEDDGAAAATALERAERRVRDRTRPDYRRLAVDIAVASGLGRFFGAKLRAGVLYRLFARTGVRAALEEAIRSYRTARTAWSAIVARTRSVYAPDITVGELRQLRGHWSERLGDIDTDIAALGARLQAAAPGPVDEHIRHAIAEVLGRPVRPDVAARHVPPDGFRPGDALALEFVAAADHASVTLHFRRVNQAERWHTASMVSAGRAWRATIPSDYTKSPYPLQYYVEMRDSPASAGLFPGLGDPHVRVPYFVVRGR
jgi:hypothetical protein